MQKYKIVRMYLYSEKKPSHIIATGLTLEEAQKHCRDIETSSQTCTNRQGKARTKKYGSWFDGYQKE